MKNSNASKVAFCGVFAAAALTVMTLVGIVPLATYITPMICCLFCNIVYLSCGRIMAWVWYVAVSILSLLIGPDKEAAFVFMSLGYYPILKPWFDKIRYAMIVKILYFNLITAIMYLIILRMLGLEEVTAEYSTLGVFGTILTVILGSITFVLLDTLLNRFRWNGKNEVK